MRKNEKIDNSLSGQVTLFLSLCEKVRPSSFMDYRLYLYSLYRHLRSLDKNYSFQKFAVHLDLNSEDEIKNVILCTDKLAGHLAPKIADILCLSPFEKEYFLNLVKFTNSSDSKVTSHLLVNLISIKANLTKTSLSKKQKHYFSRWFIPAIGEMVGLDNFIADPEWIAKMLIPKIPPEEARECLALLVKLGILRFDKNQNEYDRTGFDFSTGDEVAGTDLVRYHKELIDLGKHALDNIPSEQREISTITLSLSEQLVQKIKTLIHEFENQVLAEEAGNSPKERIYQMNIQFFPLTKIMNKKR